jgi:uncharacterized protein YceK
MKKVGVNLTILLLSLSLCGCVSMAVIDEAQGHDVVNKGGVTVQERNPKPGYYALLPLTIPLDVALFAASLYANGCSYGSFGGSGGGSGGLKVQRP